MADADLAGLVPLRDRRLRVVEIDQDVAEIAVGRTAAELRTSATPGRSYVVVFGRSGDARRSPLLINSVTARILELSDGTRTVADILQALNRETDPSAGRDLTWVERVFAEGLVSLQAEHTARAGRRQRT